MIITCMQEVKLSDAKSLFRVVSPNHKLAWGEEVSSMYHIVSIRICILSSRGIIQSSWS